MNKQFEAILEFDATYLKHQLSALMNGSVASKPFTTSISNLSYLGSGMTHLSLPLCSLGVPSNGRTKPSMNSVHFRGPREPVDTQPQPWTVDISSPSPLFTGGRLQQTSATRQVTLPSASPSTLSRSVRTWLNRPSNDPRSSSAVQTLCVRAPSRRRSVLRIRC
ncbi:hypothetical protein FKP32DRAFT_5996 [Trametes sanguinea]|nr:hypothetical protein FKP32DRAFT_5996 [Trametes sanguinea]